MKTLKEFMAKRKYVAVVYDDISQKKLRKWATDNGFDLTTKFDGEKQEPEDFDFHTTIFYSTNEANLRHGILKETPTEVIITGIKFLGENKDIPVLSLSLSGGLKDIREHFEGLGLEDEWPTYKPHISLSYAKKQIDVSNIKIPDFRPKFDKIKIRDIEE